MTAKVLRDSRYIRVTLLSFSFFFAFLCHHDLATTYSRVIKFLRECTHVQIIRKRKRQTETPETRA
jgi:hypothetical protein